MSETQTLLSQPPAPPTHPAEVLLRRRFTRKNFRAWCDHQLAIRGQSPALHHKLIIAIVQAITTGDVTQARQQFPHIAWPDKVRNVMLLMPPGSAKSTYTSVLFPPWHLANQPDHLFLACSYSYTLVESFGRQCRDLIDTEGDVLGYKLSKTAASAGDWRIVKDGRNRGGYFCAGVGSGIAGYRADVALIDDYIGTQEDADSATMREKVWQWYWNDFWPRLKPNAAQFIIANRRHEDDLVGRLLAKEGDKWLVIRLPMLAEDNDPLGRQRGERLWPEWFTEEMVDKARQLSRVWAGLYQQRPAPEEGDYFKRDWLVMYDRAAYAKLQGESLRYYVGSDWAVSEEESNDEVCFIPVAVDANDDIWVLPDWFWAHSAPLESVEAMLDLAKKYKPLAWYMGKEVITKSLGPYISKRMQERNVYVPIVKTSEAHDKLTKNQPLRARMQQRKVHLPDFAPRIDEAMHQLLTFPGAKHDDFVDALGKIGTGLSGIVPAEAVVRSAPITLPIVQPITFRHLKELNSERERRERFALQDN